MNQENSIGARFGIIYLLLFSICLATAPALNAAGADEFKNRVLLAGLFDSGKKGPAPEFELQDLNGTTVKLSQYRGNRPVMLYFWATWCPACMSMKPHIAKVREKVPAADLEILGINVGEGDSLEKVKRYQEGHPATYPILYDTGSKVSRAYRVQGIPLFVLVDKDGQIVYQGNDLPQNPMKLLK
jgi:thiol-disulfide isomerase/thioredoxin